MQNEEDGAHRDRIREEEGAPSDIEVEDELDEKFDGEAEPEPDDEEPDVAKGDLDSGACSANPWIWGRQQAEEESQSTRKGSQ